MNLEDYEYLPDTGLVKNKRTSKIVGSYTRKYGRFIVNSQQVYIARFAVFKMLGFWPEEVDHINGDTHDNRWENLRPCSRLQNSKNRKTYQSSKTGIKGVFKKAYKGREFFVASIQSDGVRHFLGHFNSIEDADKAYKAASEQFHKEFSRKQGE